MNKNTAIEIKNLSKQYKLGTVSTGTLSHDLKRWWHLARGREDPFLKIGDSNDRSQKSDSGYVWALKDINFEIKQGEVMGIIGKNGAGKSTLLKILSRVTGPTTGEINYRGRIGALLEVGTGFHPELTGRENIFLNGAILGMTRAEIIAKFDEIVDFSGCGKYVDTPVKRYSSGMMVRLGFAVAAFLEPEILVVDEVLAVGDAEFQKKAIGKMQDVSSVSGRTVLFVSHNMASVKEICNKAILLIDGKIKASDEAGLIIEQYLKSNTSPNTANWIRKNKSKNGHFFNAVRIKNKENDIADVIGTGDDFKIEIELESTIETKNTIIAIQFNDVYGNPVLTTSSSDYENFIDDIEQGINKYKINIPENIFMPGTYYLIIACFESGKKLYDIIENELSIKIEDLGTRLINRASKGVVYQKYKWEKV